MTRTTSHTRDHTVDSFESTPDVDEETLLTRPSYSKSNSYRQSATYHHHDPSYTVADSRHTPARPPHVKLSTYRPTHVTDFPPLTQVLSDPPDPLDPDQLVASPAVRGTNTLQTDILNAKRKLYWLERLQRQAAAADINAQPATMEVDQELPSAQPCKYTPRPATPARRQRETPILKPAYSKAATTSRKAVHYAIANDETAS